MCKRNGYQYKLLAVDDNVNSLEIIRRTLGRNGYEVMTCNGVENAVEVLNNHEIDLVITDLKMPKRSGLDLIRYVSDSVWKTSEDFRIDQFRRQVDCFIFGNRQAQFAPQLAQYIQGSAKAGMFSQRLDNSSRDLHRLTLSDPRYEQC